MVSISEQVATTAAGAQRGHACELHDTLVNEYYINLAMKGKTSCNYKHKGGHSITMIKERVKLK